MDIPTDQELAQKIMREYSRINMNEMLHGKQMDGEKIAAIALKLALDFAQGKQSKVHLSEESGDFVAVPLYGKVNSERTQKEETLGIILQVFESVEDQGEDISHLLPLLEGLAPYLWRSAIQIALGTLKQNLSLLNDGIKLVTPDTHEPITKENELRAMEAHLEAARSRIGEAMIRDLEEEVALLRSH